jgi:predicted esterase
LNTAARQHIVVVSGRKQLPISSVKCMFRKFQEIFIAKSMTRFFIAAYVGVSMATAAPPPVTNDAPAAGKRVRVTTPGAGYAGNAKVYHTLYLPTDWVPRQKYPVIIEYGGNGWTVEANKLGYYQSGGIGFIWVSAPNIDQNSTLGDKSDDFNTTSWWGSEGRNAIGAADDAAYTKATVIDLIENYGGDHSRVFVTGFSRGAVACGNLGRLDDSMSDIWLAFLPHSHHDAWFDNGTRTDRIKGRASFITYGENDGGGGNSRKGTDWLNTRGFPVESYELAGTVHTDEWITDTSAPLASSLSDTGHPLVTDVRARLRTWLGEVSANRPGTSSISGSVTDASGSPIEGARIQCGDTHWTFTNANGDYLLESLIDSNRILSVSHPSYNQGWQNNSISVQIAGADLTGQDFQTIPVTNAPPTINTLAPANISTDVALSANLVITFDKLVQKGTGNIVIQKTTGGTFETIPISSASVTVSGATVTINPSTDFAVTTGYFVEIANGVIKDTAATPHDFAGTSGSGTWSFTTGTPDITAPSIDTLSPGNSSTGVAVSSELVITFDEDVKKGSTGTIVIQQSTGGNFEIIPVHSSHVTVGGKQLTISPSNLLANSTGYYVEIADAAIEDLAGNAFAGITGSATWGFITSSPSPSPSIITPVAAATPTVSIYGNMDTLIDGSGLDGNGVSGGILSETHDYGAADNSWHSANVAANTIEMTFDLGGTFTVGSAHIWNWNAGNGVVNRSVKTVDISFSTDGGATYGNLIDNLGDFAKPSSTTPATVDPAVVQVSTIAFPTAVSGVTHIKLTDFTNHGDSYTAMSEIRFGAPGGSAATPASKK